MFTAIIGAHRRTPRERDREVIQAIVNTALEADPSASFVSTGCTPPSRAFPDPSIGYLVKETCGLCRMCGHPVKTHPNHLRESDNRRVPGSCQKKACECGEWRPTAPFVELNCVFQGFDDLYRISGHIESYLARNMSIYALCNVFHLFVQDSRNGIIEHLIDVLRNNPKQYAVTIYSEAHEIIDNMGFEDQVGGDDVEETQQAGTDGSTQQE